MELKVYKRDGAESGEVITIPDELLERGPAQHAVYLCVVAEETNSRQGTCSSKNRSMVRGGGKKPWRQKGRGTARAGTNRSPIWKGGGTILGPEPRVYYKAVNKKTRKVARQSVLREHLRNEQLKVVEDFDLEKPRTKEMVAFTEAFQVTGRRILFLTPELRRNLYLSSRNIYKFKLLPVNQPSVRDLVNSEVVFVQKSAVEALIEGLK